MDTITSIRYCKGHGWQLLAGQHIDWDDIESCDACVVVKR